jgi:putative toxin-antitoxin system antitoxin component (TIGR02293 family)
VAPAPLIGVRISRAHQYPHTDVISGAAFVESVERGLPRSAITELKRFSHLSDSRLAAVIPRRTLTSMRRSHRLTTEQSDRIARTAGIVADEITITEGSLKAEIAAYLSRSPVVGVAGTGSIAGLSGRLKANCPKLRRVFVAMTVT